LIIKIEDRLKPKKNLTLKKSHMTVKQKIIEILKKLNEGVIEKEEVLALTLVSSIAGESIFFLGPPGVAKSLIARKLKYVYKDGASFEYLMNRFSTPDEIFGPVSISKLKDQDKYERIVTNYLPSATVVFLDEIWKAGPSIQNTLLTVLNEKKYRNGDQEIDIPLKSLVSASNELPNKDQGLEALWDRFLIRLIVNGISDKEKFNRMISESLNSYSDTVEENLKITDEEYKKWSKTIDEIEILENVFNVIHVIRNYINQYNQKEENKENPIYISDRRWRKIVRLLRTSAFLNDRKAVDLMDCFLIKDCLWNETEQIQATSQFVKDAIQKHGYKLEIDLKDLREEIKDFKNEVDTYTNEVRKIKYTEVKVYKIQNNNYLRVLDLQSKFTYPENDLIEQSEILSLKDNYIHTKRHKKDLSDRDEVFIKKGKSNFTLNLSSDSYINGFEFQLETKDATKEEVFTKKPHHATQKHWDKEVAKYLTTTSNLKHQISHYRNNDLINIRLNLFVNPSFAEIVENNLISLEKAIDKIEIEVKQIQHYYENVEDKQVKTNQKALKNE